MAKKDSNHITSCTISWENTEDILSVVTKVLQTEIHVRLYNNGSLISGRIWQMSEQQKEELYSILYKCNFPFVFGSGVIRILTEFHNIILSSSRDLFQDAFLSFFLCKHGGIASIR